MKLALPYHRMLFAALVGSLFVAILWVVSQFREPPTLNWQALLWIFLVYLSYEAIVQTQKWAFVLQNRWPSRGRQILIFLISLLVGTLSFCLLFYGFKWLDYGIHQNEPPRIAHMSMALFVGLTCSTIFSLVELLAYHRKQVFQSQLDKERYEKQILTANFKLLTQQLDPHFLLNNFNTLYYLIEEDPEHAQAFLKNMAAIYQHILHYKDQDTVDAEEEYQIAKQFLSVLKQRFGQALQIDDQIESQELRNKKLPALVIQQLLENAVKHNRIDDEQPLHISLKKIKDQLEVSNTVAPKKQRRSTGTGLANIQDRYQYLLQKGIAIQANDQYFSVTIPLIYED